MTAKDHNPRHAAEASLGQSRDLRRWFRTRRNRVRWGRLRRGSVRLLRRRWLRRTIWGFGISVGVIAVGIFGLWWRLASGPIAFDFATPQLTAAIAENLGGEHKIEIGGTQIERDEHGRTALRIRDIVVRDRDGTVVASAPKAEVGLSGSSLLTGRLRAESLNLVGAELAVRIETDGTVTVFAGANARPIVTAPPGVLPPPAPADGAAPAVSLRGGFADLAAALAWIDNLGATGLDGHDLREVGLKNGNLTVDDQRNGKRWTFSGIDVSFARPEQGGVMFRLASENPERPWQVSAALRPLEGGVRAVGIEARRVPARDLLLALRLGEGAIETDLPLSASVRAEFTPDGTLQAARGQLIADAGFIRDPHDAAVRLPIEHADIRFAWDRRQQAIVVPFQIQSGGNQITLLARIEPMLEQSGVWSLTVDRGDPVIDPIILAAGAQADDERFALNRATLRARIDTVRRRIDVVQGDLGRTDVRPTHNIGVAITGSLDLSDAEPRLAFGIAGTRMPVSVMKRLWPIMVAPHIRRWVDERISGGVVERVLIAGNVTVPVLMRSNLPIPDEGLSIDIDTSGTTLRPIASLPPIRDADLTVRVTGRTARVNLGRGTIEVEAGRKLNIASGTFEVPDTHPKPAPASARFRLDGSVAAAAVLLASETLRGTAGYALDPATSRGTLTAQVTLNLALARDQLASSPTYALTSDLTNFAADRLLMGQKIEAQTLRVVANSKGYQVNGDAKINGIPATLDFRKSENDSEADLRLQATLDEASRRKIGIDFGAAVTGSIPVKVTGRIGPDERQNQINVEADLTPAKIDNLLPGWVKPPGKSARATFRLVKDGASARFDALTIEGQGALAKGSVEIDSAGELVSANFPTFALSDGDKMALMVERGPDAALHVQMRGEVYDGRHFVKSALANEPSGKTKQRQGDFDLDIKIGAVAGHNGEALRGLDLKLSRRGGRIRSFAMNAKIGRDTPLIGDLRLRSRDNHQVIYLETDDAGALFRFTELYPRMYGGQMWLAMDPPTPDNAPQVGVLNIQNFAIRGEPGLERVVAGAPGNARSAVEFSELRCDFTRLPGRMLIRDGVVRGPVVGATIDGQIDYSRNEMRLRGTFVPLYGINNMFGQIPIVGIFLGGGSNEGLFGITYEAVGPPNAPRISVNPISAIAPGLLRKLIPSPGMFDPNYIQPTR